MDFKKRTNPISGWSYYSYEFAFLKFLLTTFLTNTLRLNRVDFLLRATAAP